MSPPVPTGLANVAVGSLQDQPASFRYIKPFTTITVGSEAKVKSVLLSSTVPVAAKIVTPVAGRSTRSRCVVGSAYSFTGVTPSELDTAISVGIPLLSLSASAIVFNLSLLVIPRLYLYKRVLG